MAIMEEIKTLTENGEQSIAVLCRMNSIVNEFVAALEAWSIPVQKRVAVELPLDWHLARLLVSFLNSPGNAAIADRYTELKYGRDVADEMKIKAGRHGLNRSHYHFQRMITVERALTMLTAQGLSTKSAQRMSAVASKLSDSDSLAELTLAVNAYESLFEETGDGVCVMTLHAAKGREFDTVFLPGWNEGILPSVQSRNSPRLLAEETRLAYVGVTRARHRVMISCAQNRANPWTKKIEATEPSRFFKLLKA